MLSVPWAIAPFLLVGIAGLASANDFALNEGACGPEPIDVTSGMSTPVRMVAEHPLFRFGRHSTDVVARFRFENSRTDSAVQQLSGFPDINLGGGLARL